MVIISQLVVPEEDLVYQNQDTTLQIDNNHLPSGSLYITENCLHWKQNGKEDGISIPWPKVSVHAITSAPQKSIYLMLDFILVWPGVHPIANRNGNGHAPDDVDEDEGHVDGDEDDDAERENMTEMWLVPSDTSHVEQIYNTITQCQNLHPDEAFSDDENDDMDREFMNAILEGPPPQNGEVEMENLNLEDEGKFEDAD